MVREVIPASKEHEKNFREHYQLKPEFECDPECRAAFEYAATTKVYPDEMGYIAAIIEEKPHEI